MAKQDVLITIKALDKTKKAFGGITKGLKAVAGAALNLKTAFVGVAGAAGIGLLINRSLEATDANNCTSTSNSITYNVASVINGEEVSFRVYPNPFRKEATVDFGYTVKEATISIVDIYGKLIEQHELTNANSFVITNKNKASGVYFMKMETESELYNKKIIIK